MPKEQGTEWLHDLAEDIGMEHVGRKHTETLDRLNDLVGQDEVSQQVVHDKIAAINSWFSFLVADDDFAFKQVEITYEIKDGNWHLMQGGRSL